MILLQNVYAVAMHGHARKCDQLLRRAYVLDPLYAYSGGARWTERVAVTSVSSLCGDYPSAQTEPGMQ